MKKIRQITNAVSEKLTIPPEILSRASTVTINGRSQVVAEPHEGVLEFTPEQIRVKTDDGVLQIQGRNLDITRMNGRMIQISGEIAAVLLGRDEA